MVRMALPGLRHALDADGRDGVRARSGRLDRRTDAPMADLLNIFNLVAPFFGLILLGFAIGRYKQLPEAGLAWLQFFLIYVALPPLFYRLIADKPLSEL